MKVNSKGNRLAIRVNAAAVIVGLMFPVQARAQVEYRLQAGDVIEIAVAGIPELRHRVSVQLDGSITFPLAGTLVAEGAPISQVRSRIQSAIASKVFRARLSDGREMTRTIERDDIAAVIVEYKPIFVSGDISKQGEQPFRPRMQVRQALAAAGGASPFARGNPDAHTLRSDHAAAWLAVAGGIARNWRIKSELGEKRTLQGDGMAGAPVPEAVVREIFSVERELLATREAEHKRSKQFLNESIQLLGEQISALERERESEMASLGEELREHKKASAAFGNGNLPSRRVNDQRRAVMITSSRLLQTTSQLTIARRTLAEANRDLHKIDSQRKIELLGALQEAQIKLNIDRAKLQNIEERLQAAGIRVLRPGERVASKLDVEIYRKTVGGTVRISAEPDTELQPGDVIEVTNRGDLGLGVSP